MLWSLGLIVLLIDGWHRLGIGGIDLISYRDKGTPAPAISNKQPQQPNNNEAHRLMRNGKLIISDEDFNVSDFEREPHHVQPTTLDTYNPPVTDSSYTRFDLTTLTKLLNWNSSPEHDTDEAREKNIHNLIHDHGKNDPTDGNGTVMDDGKTAPEDEDDSTEDYSLTFSLRPPEDDEGDKVLQRIDRGSKVDGQQTSPSY